MLVRSADWSKAVWSVTPRGSLLRRHRVTPRLYGLPSDVLTTWLSHHALAVMDQLQLAFERVALPCSTMQCGDMFHRSTLDPTLRMEARRIAPLGVLLIAMCVSYFFLRPGVLPGVIDFYFSAALQRRNARVYTKDDLKLGKKIGGGGFGMVYKAELDVGNGQTVETVVKKTKEFGEAEVWMNERLMRLPNRCCAEFITAFEEDSFRSGSWRGDKTSLMYSGDAKGVDYHTADPPLWLVWKYEGDYTLYDLLQQKDFPYNLEPYLLGRPLSIPKGPFRKLVTIKAVMQQILEALDTCHSVGIVHRDVKPQNCIISERTNRIKFIDLGAAADLRIGINYVPNEFLLDPRYAPPQNYIMSTQTPKAPVAPLAALLSPILWSLEKPDRFDMYSTGVVLLQMVFPNLRSDNNLIAFNRKLESMNYDLAKWRSVVEKSNSKDFKEGFQLLDLDDQAGWEFVKKVMAFEPGQRPSAAQALRQRFFVGGPSSNILENLAKSLNGVAAPVDVVSSVQRTDGMDGLTENQLAQELGVEFTPQPDRNASYTIAWWKERQAQMTKKAKSRGSKGVNVIPNSVSETK